VDWQTRFRTRILAMAFLALVSGLFQLLITTELAAIVAGMATCVVALAAWEYRHWKARRRR
jgi:hypothetical protein